MKEFDFEKVPIVEIANEILLDGVKKGASDIHFDPQKDGLSIRMRVDGVLYDYSKVPADFKRNMVSRIKMIAGMNIMETRLPQDGAIKSKIGDKTLDLRVSTLPCHTGEKVVLRILDYTKSLQGLESLGFSQYNLKKIKKMIDMPNGIVLVTGATGSGKSTTVYSILQKLNTREVNIITVEDPVEMEVAGLNQVQAQHEIGLDFATVLRSILRQDPDIIMIGEIRDGETASIAVRSSITGHKVVSTIHTNSALNTIERLTDMGIERYLIGTSLNGIISQKLPRKLCQHCRISRETTDYEKSLFKKVLHAKIDKIYDVNKEGCEHCFKGYRNRIAIAEVLVITDEVRNAITNSESKDVMRKLVYVNSHTHTLLEDGLEKVAIGETNFEEILKMVDLENDLAIHNAFYDEVEQDIKNGKEKRFSVNSVLKEQEEAETSIMDEYKDEIGKDTEEENNENNNSSENTTAVAVPVPVEAPTSEVQETTQGLPQEPTPDTATQVEAPTLEVQETTPELPQEPVPDTTTQVEAPTLEVQETTPELPQEPVPDTATQVEAPTLEVQEATQELPQEPIPDTTTQVEAPTLEVQETTQEVTPGNEELISIGLPETQQTLPNTNTQQVVYETAPDGTTQEVIYETVPDTEVSQPDTSTQETNNTSIFESYDNSNNQEQLETLDVQPQDSPIESDGLGLTELPDEAFVK